MLDKIATSKWLNAAAAAGMTIFALSLWTSNSHIVWKLLSAVFALLLISDAYKMFRKAK